MFYEIPKNLAAEPAAREAAWSSSIFASVGYDTGNRTEETTKTDDRMGPRDLLRRTMPVRIRKSSP